jgi:hypothetical protein
MPYVTARDGQLAVVYYEARSDAQAPGGIVTATGLISGMQRQVDVRGALVDPAGVRPTTSFQISRYQIDSGTGKIKINPGSPPELGPRVNYANFPMYLGGIAPFIGDYIHAIPLRPDGSGAGFRVAFTSNETVEPPAGLDFRQYDNPHQGTLSTCNPGSRNSTVMTAEVGTDLVVGSPGTFKQLVNAQNQPVQRAFAVYVENHTAGFRAFRLTVTPTANVVASFEQFGPVVTTVDVEILASSSATRTVYLSGAVATGSAVVNVVEISLINPSTQQLMSATPLGLTASLTLNGDGTNPFVGGLGGNPGLANTETHTPQLGTPQLGTPQLGTPQLGSPQLGTPQLGTPQLGTPQLGSAQISSPQLGSVGPTDPTITDITYKITNAGNTASGYNSLISLTNAQHLQQAGHTFQVIIYRVHQTASAKGCATGKAQQDQVIYMTPQLGTPQLGTPQLGSPQLGTPQLGSPQLASASFTIAPADPTPTEHDGTEHEHQGNDFLMLDLRIRHPPGESAAQLEAEMSELAANFALSVEAQAANTGNIVPDGSYYGPDLRVAGAPAPASIVAGPGETVTLFPFTLTNAGNAAANSPAGSVTSRIYLSTDNVITTADTPVGSAIVTPNNQLGPGAQVSVPAPTIVMPPVGSGQYYIGILADSPNQVGESLETNNFVAVPLTVPTLQLRFVAQPANSHAGKRLALAATPEAQAYYVHPSNGEVVLPGVPVTLSLGTNPTGASLLGPTSGTTGPGGTVKFGNVWIDYVGATSTPGSAAAAAGYVLSASSPNFVGVASASFTVLAKRVLIYPDSFVENQPDGAGETPNERSIAQAQGYTTVIPTGAQWSALTTDDFKQYNSVVIPDSNHHHNPVGTAAEGLARAESTRTTWSPAVAGPKVVIGTDPVFHQVLAGPPLLMRNGINFASSSPDTGLFVALSTAYFGATSADVAVLDQFGTFKVTSLESSAAHIDLPGHPTMVDLTDAVLSGWGSSVHSWFDAYPGSWKVVAVEGTAGSTRVYIIADR